MFVVRTERRSTGVVGRLEYTESEVLMEGERVFGLGLDFF